MPDSAAGRQLMDPNVRCPNCIDLADTLRRVVANEANHYDAWFFPPPDPLTDGWLDETEAKMREALNDVFCDDAAKIMLTLIAEIRAIPARIASNFERLASHRNPDDPEGSARYSDWAMNAADRIRHPERYEGVAANDS